MCYKSRTYRSVRTDRHKNARPYVREKNLTYSILNSEDYVANITTKKKPNG